jgi:hydrogenase nickel incorporation protein HypB
MCANCGCSEPGSTIITDLQTNRHIHLPNPDGSHPLHSHPGHEHSGREHHHNHHHSHDYLMPSRILKLEQNVLTKNERLAERNRTWFAEHRIVALNVMSSPGAGKTTLLEQTIKTLGGERSFYVIEGDQATLRDAERVRAAGAHAVQINTGAGCHLDAEMVFAAVNELKPAQGALLLIENVGNLVCPALFQLGEQSRVVVASITEGDDKPLKYPHMFRSADVIVLNKMDLLAHVNFNVESFTRHARELNPAVTLLPVSATCGTGMEAWYQWLTQNKI